jgi:hypothetical protein
MLLDEFFAPTGGSMFFYTKGNLLRCKMVPGFIRGIGSFLRHKFMDFKQYDVKFPDVGWLMAKWHTASYKVLTEDLPEIPEGKPS